MLNRISAFALTFPLPARERVRVRVERKEVGWLENLSDG
jgi:hypothetical protein